MVNNQKVESFELECEIIPIKLQRNKFPMVENTCEKHNADNCRMNVDASASRSLRYDRKRSYVSIFKLVGRNVVKFIMTVK